LIQHSAPCQISRTEEAARLRAQWIDKRKALGKELQWWIGFAFLRDCRIEGIA
jgi:hypothetical protein